MEEHRERFQRLLRELFRFECADLDFGIYRIMNYKRDRIEEFIANDLGGVVERELGGAALAEQAAAGREAEEVRGEIVDSFGADSLDADGVLAAVYRETPFGIRYLEAMARAADGLGRDAQETAVFNHLHTFFSRYYQDGDFISKRRYSRRQRYAVPYNGQEVYLYWANQDQYYIKTAEHFHEYAFTADGVHVRFKMTAASVPYNNVKAEPRFFLPRPGELEWDKAAGGATVPFEYRPLTAPEAEAYGTKNRQDKIVAEAEQALLRLAKKTDGRLHAALSATGDGWDGSALLHHLRRYTRRNTSDFFIHRDLGRFLRDELDFYLKNEVLNLDEMEHAGEDCCAGWFQLMRIIKAVGARIIDFLDQIESFQKMLWEKRKFVVDTQYCLAVGLAPSELHRDIAACDAQWREWMALLGVDADFDPFAGGKKREERRLAFLRERPSLVLDTKHFSADFVDRLLAAFPNLDEVTDGVLVHSENYQALALMLEKYRERVKCVYIDPPYNSKTSEILYKNTYKHSSWLSLMDNRLEVSRLLAARDGSHVVAIDENEQEVLGRLLSKHFPDDEKVCVSVVHNKKGIQGDYFSYNHDFAFFCMPRARGGTNGLPVPEAEWEYTNLRKWGRESERETARNCFYPIFVEDGEIVGFGDVCDVDFHPGTANVPVAKGGKRIAVYPVDSKHIERKWRYARNSVEGIRDLLRVHVTSGGDIQIHKALSERQFKTVWDDSKYIAGDYGTKWLTDLGLKLSEDLYPKSVHTVADSVFALSDPDSHVLDYFAGSGTTGHAVINLNREDGGRRKFTLVEMGDYFDTVTLPRIKKVVYAPVWKNGLPERTADAAELERGPRIVKYMRLESYEDALDNIAFDRGAGASAQGFDDYPAAYMLEWETRASATLLRVEKLASPFRYTLAVARNGETAVRTVDVPETFNYLLGLDVDTRTVHDDEGRRYLVYRGRAGSRRVAVIWRDTAGWGAEELARDKRFVAERKLADGADEVFVNGDSFIPGARALEPVFKARMLAPVE